MRDKITSPWVRHTMRKLYPTMMRRSREQVLEINAPEDSVLDAELANSLATLVEGGSGGSTETNPDVIEYIPDLDIDVEGKFYNTIEKCADKLSETATILNETIVKIQTTKNNGRTNNYAPLSPSGNFYDYVNYFGAGHNAKVVFDHPDDTIANKVRFKDLSIFFGRGISPNTLSLTDMSFVNCKLYFYRTAVIVNSELDNCTLIIDPAETVTIQTSEIKNPLSTKELSIDSPTKQYGVSDSNYAETLPTDPSL